MKKILCFIILLICPLFISCKSVDKEDSLITEKTISVGEAFMVHSDGYSITTSDDTIVSISPDGLCKGLKEGSAIISLSNADESYDIAVTVNDKFNRFITIDCKQTIGINETIKLEPKVINTTLTYIFKYESSDESICKVDNDGNITGLCEGICTIKVFAINDETITRDFIVYVKNNDSKDKVNEIINNKNIEYTGNIDLTSLNGIVNNVYEEYKDSIVGVSNYQKQQVSWYSQETKDVEASTGTGVVFKKEAKGNKYDYYILTNNHVVQGANFLKVYFGYDGEYVDCTLVNTNSSLDLAVVKLTSDKDLKVVPFAPNNSVSVGDFAIAIGNSYGYNYFGTTTFGIISYVNRVLEGETAVYYQHDAAINPGNSGGPLFNINGEIIGINTLKIVNNEVENMGFSITVETIKNYLSSINIAI